MKILSLSACPLDPFLGSGKTRLRWSEGLRALGHEVEMAEPQDYQTWQGMSRALRFRLAWGACAFVKERLRAGSYDLIEFFGGEFGLVTRQLSKLRERPLIVAHTDGLELLASERERDYDPASTPRMRLRKAFAALTHEPLSRAAFVYADAFVTGCELDREYVLRRGLYPEDRAAVVEPGLDAEYLSMPFVEQKEDRVAYFGSWIARKGVGLLSAVMGRVLKRLPHVRLDVYGTGGEHDAVLASFPPEVRERVTVHPRLSNREIAEGLRRAKVFFFPTQYEGFGMALAEAMACSCVPVTTRTGFGAALRDGEVARLCDFGDAAEMERAVVTLLHDDELRGRMARRAWARVRSLAWETNVCKLEALYREWTGEHQRGLGPRAVQQRAGAFRSATMS